MERLFRSRILAPGIAGLLGLALLISPWSLSTQTRGSFSLALDLDDAEGDQAVSSLDVSPGQVVPIQIFGSDIQGASSLSVRFGYDTTQVVYVGFDAGDVLPDAQALAEQDSTSVRIDVASLSGSTVNTGLPAEASAQAGLVGTARFRATDAFSETGIRLVRAELARGGQSEVASPALGVALQLAAPPSPDFNGNGRVDFADFVLFAGAFGYREGDERYEARYDLNGDGGIAFDDFVIFANSFGNTVNRAPVFAPTPVTRSVVENSPAGEPIGSPITAADADGNALSYSLRGADADSFAIDAGTGQLRTREGIAYDHEAKNRYSVTVRVSDGEGGRTIVVVGIAVTDADEPPSAPPSGVVVAPGDSALTVRWDAAHDEAGKPPVSGYEVAHLPAAQDSAQAGRPEDSGDWKEGQILNSRTDTSVTLTRLNNEQTYQVRVRTLNDEGTGQWSTPVSGTPTGGPEVAGVIPDQDLIVGGGDVLLNVANAFTRPAQGTLTYTAASSDEAIATVTVSDSIATVRPVAAGRATITATAGDVYGNTAQTTFAVVVVPRPPRPPTTNQAPTFNEGASTTRSVAENTRANRNIQHPVRATDDDGHRLTYRLTGTDEASFAVDTGSGQLRTRSGVAYDYETKVSYSVTVEADDRNGGIAAIEVTVHVADVDEPPEAPDRPRVEAASSTSLTVTWDEPANTGPAITDYDVQYKASGGAFTDWDHRGTAPTTTITGLTSNTDYEVQVLARNDEGDSPWSPSGVGTTRGPLISVCDRVPPIRDAIVNAIPGIDACGDVTASHLAAIASLDVRRKDARGLDAGDFSGLTGMENLVLEHVDIRVLPNGVFSGLNSLKKIKIYDGFLSELNAGIFAGLPALESLDLRANFLTTLPAGVFSRLSRLKSTLPVGQQAGFPGCPCLFGAAGAGGTLSERESIEHFAEGTVFRSAGAETAVFGIQSIQHPAGGLALQAEKAGAA